MKKIVNMILLWAALNACGCFIGVEVYKQAYKATLSEKEEAIREKDTYKLQILETRLANYLDVICDEDITFSTKCYERRGIIAPLKIKP